MNPEVSLPSVVFETPLRLTNVPGWHGHIPFAFWCVAALRPRMLVELGTHKGDSYCAFCQAVDSLKLDCSCYAVDTWKGDDQAGFYGEEVLKELRAYHDPHYAGFSRLLRCTFDEAADQFANGSIDLLHFDGLHTYEAIKHDFETWRPKLSPRGVALFHDIGVRERDFGVWQLWDELCQVYPHFSFLHSYGLGVLAVGSDVPAEMARLVGSTQSDAAQFRQIFERLGEAVSPEPTSELGIQLRMLQEQRSQLLAEVAGADQHVKGERERAAELAQTLASIEGSVGWRTLNRIRGLREKVMPAGTRRRRLADRCVKGTNILLSEGVGGLMAAVRNMRGREAGANGYLEWIAQNEPGTEGLAQQREAPVKFEYRPLISVVMPTWNAESGVFLDAVRSVIDQTYDHWELCIAGDVPTLPDWASHDPRIKTKPLAENLGISGNSNAALALATGEFIALLDHDDVLAPFALFEVVKALNANPDLDFIYTDRDHLSADGKHRFAPLLKPDWSPELMLSANYLTHLTVIRKALIDKVGDFRPEFDGAQDWDLFLRVLNETDRIAHVPVIAYHWRRLPTSAASGISAKPYAQQRQLEVVTSHLRRLGLQATATFAPNGALRVTWPVSRQNMVSIIIPNRDKVDLLRRCIETLTRSTRYANFEIIVVENGSAEDSTFRYYDELKGRPNVRVVSYDRPFNYSAVNNFGAQHASGNLFLFLNNDVEITDLDWLDELVRWAERPEIGAVGAKLLYKNGRIQHAGVVVGLTGFAGHPYAGCREGQFDSFGSTEWYRDYLAVTGACLMVRKDVFEQAGGFDEQLALCGSDVEFCLRLRDLGYRTVYTPFAKLVHHESATRGTAIPGDDFRRSFAHYERYLRDGDPFFNRNLSYWHTTPRLRSRDDASPAQFCRSFLDQLPQTPAITESSMVAEKRTIAPAPKRPAQSAKGSRRARTWFKRKVLGSRLARFIPLWARYSHDATVLAHWLDYSDADLEASQLITSGTQFEGIQTVNWFIPEVEHAAFGGIFTILRFASRFKREYGVQNRFVVIGSGPVERTVASIGGAFPELADQPVIKLTSLAHVDEVPRSDAAIATLWTTAYFLLRFNQTKRKFYFIQDCEPMFYPAGSTAAQVEATYRFGFYGIANTRTLKQMYEQRYGGVAEYFDPAVDISVFHPAEIPAARDKVRVFFYGRPDHPRNAFELGLAALKTLKKNLGERVEIVSAGAQWQPGDFGVQGVVNNLGLMKYAETAELYRTCDIGLLLMFTRHPSYIPFELMASGCVVVTNWNPDTTWLMQDDINCVLSSPSATCLADSITALARDPERMQRLRLEALRTIREKHSDWTAPIDKIFEFMCRPQRAVEAPAAVAEEKAWSKRIA